MLRFTCSYSHLRFHEILLNFLNETSIFGSSEEKTFPFQMKAMKQKIGYPDFILDDSELNEIYQGVRK